MAAGKPHVRTTSKDDTIDLVECDQCKGRWHPAQWDARGRCPSCANPTGTDRTFKRDEA